MSNIAATDAQVSDRVRLTDSQWRARRIGRQRAALRPLLEELLEEIPEVVDYHFSGLHHLPGYRLLESEGLVHAGIRTKGGCFTIIAATRRVLLSPKLRVRLFAIRRLARAEPKKTIVVGPRSLQSMIARLRAARSADPTALSARTGGR